ncbi:hypothetical protein Taro_024356 [Colocasia esculenta]|uniref:Uncharacterized protein n=1 Tax=Colocasia esculenta TaxID=4460 RepID=A0A843VDF4_COLES|nr:hypothetical protein [Colocasia esculenta]
MLTLVVGRRRPPTSRSGRDVGLRHVPNRSAFLSKVSRTELSKLCSAKGGCCGRFAGRFGVLEWFSARSRREDFAWNGGDVVSWLDCVFFAKVWCWLVSTVPWLVLVERQLDLSSVTARLRGSSCVVLSGLDTSVMN